MSVMQFAADLADIVRRAPIAIGRPLRWTFIANPRAGGFTIGARWKKHSADLLRYAEAARRKPIREAGAEPSRTARDLDAGDGSFGLLGLLPTQRPAHAGEIVRALIDEAAADSHNAPSGARPFHLLVIAGGDGTGLEALTALFYAPPEIRNQFAVLRLPMGTGNDGADARQLDKALDKLVEPTKLEFNRAIQLKTATEGKGPFPAFNILSVGLDAYVTRMTNRMKGRLPGDSYKLWVDLATLFYDRVYVVGEMDVTAEGPGGRLAFRDRILLLAMGASGHRTYGSDKRILPDDRNVCAVKEINVFRKIALKKLFITGQHAGRPEARLFNASKIEISYKLPLLAQMDGEDIELEPKDFPITMELTDPLIPVLRLL